MSTVFILVFPLPFHVPVPYLSFYRTETQLSFDGDNLDSGAIGCVSLGKSLYFSGSVSLSVKELTKH